MSKPSLGAVPIESGTFEHDLAVGNRYQAFSIELLRLSLAGLGGIGFLLTENLTGANARVPTMPLLIAAAAFGFAAACATAHRYLGTDALSCHLKAIRHQLRGLEADTAKAEAEKKRRNRWFRICKWLLWGATCGTSLGAISIALGLIWALY